MPGKPKIGNVPKRVRLRRCGPRVSCHGCSFPLLAETIALMTGHSAVFFWESFVEAQPRTPSPRTSNNWAIKEVHEWYSPATFLVFCFRGIWYDCYTPPSWSWVWLCNLLELRQWEQIFSFFLLLSLVAMLEKVVAPLAWSEDATEWNPQSTHYVHVAWGRQKPLFYKKDLGAVDYGDPGHPVDPAGHPLPLELTSVNSVVCDWAPSNYFQKYDADIRLKN